MRVDFTEFFKLIMVEFGTVPMFGVVMITAVSVFSSVVAVLVLDQSNVPSALQALCAVLVAVGWVVTIYALSMMMIASPASLLSFIKYLAAAIAALIPFGAAIGLMFLAGALGWAILMAIAMATLLVLFFGASLLSGWPILQATSTKLIGPVAALKLTRGFRWPLVMAGMALGGLNRLVPSPSESDSFAAVSVLSGAGAIVSAFTGMFAVSISVAAWRLMLANQGAKD